MTNIITISAVYSCTATGVVDLSPRSWDDVKDWFIKWDSLYVTFHGDSEMHRFEINSQGVDGVDWKRPAFADIYAGANAFDDELASG